MPDQLPTLLRMVRSEPDPEPEPDEHAPEPGPDEIRQGATVRLLPLQGAQMSWLEQVNAAALHALRVALLKARETARHPRGMIHDLLNAKPPSVAEHLEYGRRRAWVPPGHEGGIADQAGFAWNHTGAVVGVAIGNWISATAHRPYRTLVTFTITYLITAAGLYAIGDRTAAIWMAGVLIGTGLLAGAGLVIGSTRGYHAGDDAEEDGE